MDANSGLIRRGTLLSTDGYGPQVVSETRSPLSSNLLGNENSPTMVVFVRVAAQRWGEYHRPRRYT